MASSTSDREQATPSAGNDQTTIHLPYEIYSIIAGFLTGDSKFGTAANLNLVSTAMRQETLPTLYETVLHDRGNPSSWRNEGYQYTKFLVFPIGSSNRPALKRRFPNLVMEVEIHDNSECGLAIYRQVSLPTILDILNTPLVHPSADHQPCGNAMSPHYRTEVVNDVRLHVECARFIKKPNPRSVEAITKLHLSDDAHIWNFLLSDGDSLQTSTELQLQDIRHDQDDIDVRVRMIENALQMLHMPAVRPPRAEHLPPNLQYQEGQCAIMRRRTQGGVYLDLSEVEASAFIRRLSEEASKYPRILEHVIVLHLRDSVTPDYILSLTEQMLQLYDTHYTSEDRRFPFGNRSYFIFYCIGTVETMPVRFRRIDVVLERAENKVVFRRSGF